MTSSSEKDSDRDSAEPAAEGGEGEKGLDDTVAPQSDETAGEADDKPIIDAGPVEESSDTKRVFGLVALLLVLAGAVGGGAGFIAGQMGATNAAAPSTVDITDDLRPVEQRIESLTGQVQELRGQVTALQSEVANIPDAEPADPVDLTPLESALDDLQARVAELDSAVSQRPVISGDTVEGVSAGLINELGAGIDQLQASVAALETDLPRRIAQLEARDPAGDLDVELESYSTQAQVDALAQRLAALESAPADTLAKQAALALSLANLVRAIELGQSFENELDTLVALAPAQPELDRLRPLAANGLKRPERLKTEFLDLARLAIQKDSEKQDAAWWEQILLRLRALVTVRPVGDVEGETTEAVIARAELRLDEGDLKSAVTELRALKGPASDVLAAWMTDAEAHLQTEDLLQALSADILRELSQLKG